MYRHANKVIANRIAEIKQRQFQISNYLESNKEVIIELQKENMNNVMVALIQEKEELERILKENI